MAQDVAQHDAGLRGVEDCPPMTLRRLLPLTIVCALGSILVWLLWAHPVADALNRAETHPLGVPLHVDLEQKQRVGIWTNNVAADLGTLECSVTTLAGEPVPTVAPPALEWSDVLWWASSRPGFSQIAGFSAPESAEYTVQCTERTGWYDGDLLVAADSFGEGSIGLGRMGAADFAQGTILVYAAVVLPLLTLGLGVMTLVAALRGRRRDAPRRTP